MIYKESPPLDKKEKEFVDDMTNLLISAICDKERLLELVIMTEYLDPTSDTRDAMAEAYQLLEETDTNMDQLNISFKTKIKY